MSSKNLRLLSAVAGAGQSTIKNSIVHLYMGPSWLPTSDFRLIQHVIHGQVQLHPIEVGCAFYAVDPYAYAPYILMYVIPDCGNLSYTQALIPNRRLYPWNFAMYWW